MKKTYNMDYYFMNDKYKISYFDILISNTNLTKEAILNDLGISYMSYNRAKKNDTKGSLQLINKLSNYFNIKNVNLKKQNEYEELLNSIIYKFYYRSYNLKEFEPILIEYINENTFLQPLFRLLLLLVRIVQLKSPHYILEEIKDEYEWLSQFKHSYFVSPFSEIFIIIEVLYSYDKLKEFDKEVVFSDGMRGLIYNVYTTNAYLSKKYDLCLYYARECRDYLIRDNNFERVILINLTYFSCLNMIGEYKKCMRESYYQLLHLIETDKPKELIHSTKIHYLVACLGARDYKEVIETIEEFATFSSTEYDFLFCASYAYDTKLFHKYLNKYENDKKKFDDVDVEYNSLIIDYITSTNKNKYKGLIKSMKYNIGFKDVLLNHF